MLSKLFLVLLAASVGLGANPGFRVHVADAGLDYFKYVAIELMNRYLPGHKFPDIPFKQELPADALDKSLGDGNVHDIVLSAFNMPYDKSYITTTPGRGLTWEANSVVLRVDMSYKQSIFKGDVTATTSTTKLVVTAKLAATASGAPSLQDVVCNFDIGNLELKFHGSFSAFFVNWFHKIIESKLKDVINGAVCDAVGGLIGKANAPLEKLPMKFDLSDQLSLDYAFIGTPVYGPTNFLDLNLRGEFFSGNIHSPEARPELPDLLQSAPMLYMQVSDYMFNSMGYAVQERGLLHVRIDQKLIDSFHIEKMPPDFMNTTCAKICLGKLAPLIGISFTDGSVFIDFISISAPKFLITPTGVVFEMTGSIQFKVSQADGSVADAFTAETWVRAELTDIKLADSRLSATSNVTNTTFKLVSSSIGEVNEEALVNFWFFIVGKVVTPALNKVTHGGFPVPSIPEVAFVNPVLNLDNRCVQIQADMSIFDLDRRRVFSVPKN